MGGKKRNFAHKSFEIPRKTLRKNPQNILQAIFTHSIYLTTHHMSHTLYALGKQVNKYTTIFLYSCKIVKSGRNEMTTVGQLKKNGIIPLHRFNLTFIFTQKNKIKMYFLV